MQTYNNNRENGKKRILFLLLPFWTPLMPPLGISCIKSVLAEDGYYVKSVDANTDPDLMSTYHTYLEILKEAVPEHNRGNFYNSGNDVLKNHLTACVNRDDVNVYHSLIKKLIHKSFFTDAGDDLVRSLDEIAAEFYKKLEKYLLGLLQAENPDVVGISTYSGTLGATVFAFELVKRFNKNIMTVMGGGIFSGQFANGTEDLERFVKRTTAVDKIIIGEGEQLFLKLLREEFDINQKVFDINDVGGEQMDVSKAAIPDFTDFDVQKYPYLTSYASRGCPFQCSFCLETVQWGKYRKKNGKKIADELAQLHKLYDYQLFLLGDSLLNPVIDEISEQLIERQIPVYWDGYLRADTHTCDLKNTLLWRRGGFYRARLGIESGSQHVLDLMNKKITPHQIKLALKSLSYAGIKTTTYWVIGHPGETEEDFCQTLALIEELKDDIYEADCNPFSYYSKGQVDSDKFASENGAYPFYSEEERDLLLMQTWVLRALPTREETHSRICRFIEHCKRIGVPNPYTVNEINAADNRWKQLHENAVPSLVEFRKRSGIISENKNIGTLAVSKTEDETGDFDF